MELIIEHFRNLHNRTFIFREGINLLSGVNGTGKSNLMACIEWILYGTCQGGSVLPRGPQKGKKAGATLIFEGRGLKICRKKGPDLFLVEKDGSQYKDKEGLALIFGYFGSPEVWKATCFVPQESRCPLLLGTKEQQISALNTLIFGDMDPLVIQKKIDVKRKEEDQEVKVIRAKIEGLAQGLDIFDDETEDLAEIKVLIMLLESEVKQLEGHEGERAEKQMRMDLLQGQLEKVRGKMDECKWRFGVIGEEEIKSMRTNLEAMRERRKQAQLYQTIQGRIEALMEERKKYPENIEGQYDMETYEILKEKNTEYRRNLNICNSENIEYNDAFISMKKVELKRILNNLLIEGEIRSKKKEIESLKGKMGNSEKFGADLGQLEDRLKEQISVYRKNESNLACPGCKMAVRFDQNALVPSDGFVVDREKLDDLDAELNNVQIYQERRREIQNFLKRIQEKETEIDRLKGIQGECKGENEEDVRRILYLLDRVEFVEKPEDPDFYLECLKGQQIDYELNMWKTDFVEYKGENVDGSDFELEEGKVKGFERAWLSFTQLKELERSLIEEVREVDVPENKKEKLEKYKGKLENLFKRREKAELAEKMQAKKGIMEGFEAEKEEKQEIIASLETLKNICKQVQSDRIDASLFALNKTSNSILESMFEEPIHLDLKATKETKQGKIRNELSVSIIHNNETLNSIRPDLSIGQANRVSMALSLALFLQTPSPFIMLDEPFAPVDSEMIDLSLRAIKNTIPKGRFAIISAHNIHGDFDHEVKL